MNNPNKVYEKNRDMVAREIDDEVILVPIYRSSKDTNEIFTLNRTAADIWNLVDGKRAISDIKKIISAKYKVSPEKLEKDLRGLIKDMKEIKAIV